MSKSNNLIESGIIMHVMKNRRGGRSLRSTLNKVLSVGACSALLATGAIIVAASPASAATTAADHLVFTTPIPPTTATAGTPLATFNVSVEDVSGDVPASTGATDSITITSNCTLASSYVATAAVGVAVFSGVTIDTGSSCFLTATDTSEPSAVTAATSASIAVTASALAKVGFTAPLPPTSTLAGSTLSPFKVSAEDAYGNVIVGGGAAAIDVFGITSACALAGTTTATAAAGVATFSGLVIDGGTSPCTLTATDLTRSLTTGTSAGVTVIAGTAAKVAFTTEPPVTVIQSAVLAPFKVSVEDVYGNVDTTGISSTDTVTITSTCTLGGTATAVAAAGVATFAALEITSTGSCALIATDSTRTLTTSQSTAVDSQGAQAALTVSSLTGYLGSPLTLTTTGGSGTGAVTFTATVGTAAGCVVSGTSLTVTSLGTCIVTATKAASTTNLAASSVATTVTFVIPGPQPKRVNGFVTAGKTKTITISGMYFSGRPRITSHAGTTAIVTKDSGKLLTVRVTVKAGSRNGTFTFTITNPNGKSGKVKYVQRA
jgi:hypothetical protein